MPINAQQDPGAQSDEEAQSDEDAQGEEAQGDEQAVVLSALERLEQNDAKSNDKLSAILECLRDIQSSGASQPSSRADPQSSGPRNHDYLHHSTRGSLIEYWRGISDCS